MYRQTRHQPSTTFRCGQTLRSTLVLLIALGTLGLAGCGQKGPLYLPQPEQAAPSAPESTQ